MGAKVIVMESSPMLGGMLTAQGVSATDGNYNLKGGIWGEFRDSLVARYDSSDALRTGWVSEIQFEPHVGDEIFKNMLAQAGDADVRYGFMSPPQLWMGELSKERNSGICQANV